VDHILVLEVTHMEMQLVNVTPHAIVIRRGDKEIVLPPSGTVARVEVEYLPAGEVAGIPIVRSRFGQIQGLPGPREGAVFVASTIVAQAAAALGRRDVVSPDTGPTAVRDEQGRISAVLRLQTFAAVGEGE
jgi:hypothetical protein